jgi:glycosyltransferase involved in cell wall biosynthesis
MKILFATTLSATWGGSEWLWAETALQLASEGHTVAFAQPWQKPHPLLNRLRQAGAQEFAALCPLRWYRRWWSQLVPRRYFELHVTTKFKPDVAILSQSRFDQGSPWFDAWAAAGVPYGALVQLVDETAYVEESVLARVAAAYAQAKSVYFVSARNHLQLELILAARLPHALVVRNPFRAPIDTPFTWPDSDGPLRLAMAARLDPIHKGHDLLFEVLARPAWQQRAIELYLYGEGSAEPRLRRLQALLGLETVKFTGYAQDPSDIWAHCHVAAVPSRCEGLPISMVEAMLHGRPVFGTAVAGIPEFVTDGVHGFLAPGCTPDLLDQTLERLWLARDRLPDIGRAAQQRARSLLPENPVVAFAREVTGLHQPRVSR